uniref:Uncharacterized protein n=1 Tax=Rangifer tarandus platyrhynchus TaxID=3082113 RepID=A0ACB0EXQ3_RANTA|nr:unnamed protein product [Rangifer tarandus platyrhynchus]
MHVPLLPQAPPPRKHEETAQKRLHPQSWGGMFARVAALMSGVTVGRASTSALQREPDFRAALKGAALRQLLDGCPLAPGPEKASRKQPGKTGLACVFTSRPAGCPHSAGEDTALGWPGSGRGPAQGAPALPALHSTRVLSEGACGHGSLSARRSSRLLLRGTNRSRFSSGPDSAVPEWSWDTGPSAVPSVGCLCTTRSPRGNHRQEERADEAGARLAASLARVVPPRMVLRPGRRRNCQLRPVRPGRSAPASFRGSRHREKSGVSASGHLPWPAERRARKGGAQGPGSRAATARRPSLPPAHCRPAELCAVVPISCENTRARVQALSSKPRRRRNEGPRAWLA